MADDLLGLGVVYCNPKFDRFTSRKEPYKMFWKLVSTIVSSHQQMSDSLLANGATHVFRHSQMVEVGPDTLKAIMAEKEPDKVWLNPSDCGLCWKNANYDLPTGSVTFATRFDAHKK